MARSALPCPPPPPPPPPPPQVPGFVSGVIWAFAQIGWFVASDNLSMVVSFPIITTIPAILANFYGITIFKEIATGACSRPGGRSHVVPSIHMACQEYTPLARRLY
eukprot:SAG22_NODE_10_length_35702_cov_72.266992_14_plen_106_part_00